MAWLEQSVIYTSEYFFFQEIIFKLIINIHIIYCVANYYFKPSETNSVFFCSFDENNVTSIRTHILGLMKNIPLMKMQC